MIPDELHARIRRLFYAEHFKVGTIAAQLGVHYTTVLHAIESHRFVNGGGPLQAVLLDPYRPFIEQTLQEYPRLTSARIHEMIRARGYGGSMRTVRRYVGKMRPAPREAYLRLHTLPGEQGQVDWASFGKISVGRAQRSLSCFVMVLSSSRGCFARFLLDQQMENFLLGHTLAFARLGGVPREILYDNLKSVVLERVGDHVRYHPRLLELAGHYHFSPKPCAPYRGNEKGRVERRIQDIRRSFFAARTYRNLDDLNMQLLRWIDEIAHQRIHEGRTVADALVDERPVLLPLPEHPFNCDGIQAVHSGKTPYIRFDRNDYSIPHALIGKSLTLCASSTEVRVLDRDQTVAQHARSYDKGAVIEAKEHIDGLAALKRHARETRSRDVLRRSCPHMDELLATLCVRDEGVARHCRILRRLLDQYGGAALDDAIAEAIQRGAVSAYSIGHILDVKARAAGAKPRIIIPDNPRFQNLTINTHSLADYDALGVTKDSDDNDKPF